LGLQDTIVRSRTISRYLEEMVGGGENVEFSTITKDEARLFTLIAKKEDAVAAKDLNLPADAKVICHYQKGTFSHVDEETTFHMDDEIVILTHSKNMPALQERWPLKPPPEQSDELSRRTDCNTIDGCILRSDLSSAPSCFSSFYSSMAKTRLLYYISNMKYKQRNTSFHPCRRSSPDPQHIPLIP
jgi:hypothetical protein